MPKNKCLDPFCCHHHDEAPQKGRFRWILNELLHHLPFSVLSAIAGIGLMAALTMADKVHHLVNVFHLFHPTHLLLSAIATTAMFRRLSYNRRLEFTPHLSRRIGAGLYAVLVGFTGSVVLCSLSDIVLPYLCGTLFGGNMDWHFCLTEHTMLVLPFVFIGILLGFWSGVYIRYSTFLSHSGHVLVSAISTLLYLIAFGMSDWMSYIGIVLLITVFSVLVPCCLSDIVYPMMFIRNNK
ncbi:MAG: hypothetical protein AB1599_02990 [Planctomycetota bacterium]